MGMAPLISVIMPVYNAEDYIKTAIESILNQTEADYELIIIDDCSDDGTSDIIRSYANIDKRIRIIRNEHNSGIVYSLNCGLKMASGKYIARMDADDYSDITRFEKQIKYLEINSNVVLCGTWTRNVGANKYEWRIKDNEMQLSIRLLFHTVIAHPTFMIRKSFLDKYHLAYDESYYPAEDYAFLSEIVKHSNIGLVHSELLRYRVHSKQISEVKKSLQKEKVKEIRQRHAGYLGLSLSQRELDVLDIINDKSRNPLMLSHREFFEGYREIRAKVSEKYGVSSSTVVTEELMEYYLHSEDLMNAVRGFIFLFDSKEKKEFLKSFFRVITRKVRYIISS